MTISKTKLLLLVILIHTVDCDNVHYITPLHPCPSSVWDSCITLSTLATNTSDYLDSRTTLVFLEGSHTLSSKLVVSNSNGFQMLSINGSGTASIVCSDKASLEFLEISQLQISQLKFIRCSSRIELVDQFMLEESRFHGGSSDSALHLNHTNASIVQSSFVFNTPGTYLSDIGILTYISINRYQFPSPLPNSQSTSAKVGGAITVIDSIVNISNCHFENNTATIGGAISSHTGSSITISNSAFVNNSATDCSDDSCHGGALFIDSGCTVTAHNSTFISNSAGYGGGAIALFQGTFFDDAHNMFSDNIAGEFGGAISAYDHSTIDIDNSHYSNNRGRVGGVLCTLHYSNIIIANSLFNNNTSSYGGAMQAYSSSIITVDNSSLDSNTADNNGARRGHTRAVQQQYHCGEQFLCQQCSRQTWWSYVCTR